MKLIYSGYTQLNITRLMTFPIYSSTNEINCQQFYSYVQYIHTPIQIQTTALSNFLCAAKQ